MRQRLFWLFAWLTMYSFAGYPVLLWVASRFRHRDVARAPITPTITVIVPAHNEETIIARKLESVLSQDYPVGLLQILVASDGSTDRTLQIAGGYADKGIRVLDYPRSGKAATLNLAAAEATGDIIIFTDANAILAPNVLTAIASNFADPTVGGVSADEQREPGTSTSAASKGERLYWEYDKWVKRAESRIGSMVSASGSLYAIRRELYRPIVDPAATDDFAISTQVVRAGYRLIFEPNAVTWEPSIARDSREFKRRVRIVTRGLRSVYGIRDLLLPWNSGIYALQVWSHKVARRLVGFQAVAILALSLSLVRRPFYRLVTLGQLGFYALATAGWLGKDKRWSRRPWFYIPYYFCLSNLAASIGIVQFLRHRTVTI